MDHTTVTAADSPDLSGRGPARRCLATGDIKTRDQLIRFVVGPTGEVVPDLSEKLPGRGLWVSADLASLQLAIKKNLFAKGAKAATRVPPDLFALTQDLFQAQLVNLLGLARRAGITVQGLPQLEAAIQAGKINQWWLATDAGADGAKKISRSGLVPWQLLSSQQLGQALGAPQLVYVGLAPHRLADKLAEAAQKYQALLAPAPLSMRNTELEKTEKND